MATLVLRAAGVAIGGLFGPIGAIIGSAVGGIAGSMIDRSLLAQRTERVGPRLESLTVMTSTEGAPIPKVFGSMRIGGQVIWATELEEITTRRTSGGKGARQTVTEYSYRANLAVGLCEGPIALVRRVWADGKPLDLSSVVWRLYRGDEAQMPDPLIVAKEGAARAPAYRGLAHIVFEGLPLEAYGNRLPQLSFEVVRPVGGLSRMLRSAVVIPGCGEFAYEDRIVVEQPRPGVSRAVNRHMPSESADFVTSIDELVATCPNLRRVALVVSWFGDDLRAGSCRIRPRVEVGSRQTLGLSWRVAGLNRESAQLVSVDAFGRPAYGGTPTDDSVLRALAVLAQRGIAVTLYPFLMMDIPAGNTLPDPQGSTTGQPAYPWRGRITVDPAPGRAGTADLTAAAANQIAAFFGTAQATHFPPATGTVSYAGPDEWRYRRFILHCAALARAAGGVDAFVIGSELVGLTRVRSAPGVYPAVPQLVQLANEARALLGAGTKIVYGADWTEYGAHVTGGGAEVRFPLDPLFAAPAIDAVALDWYAPLTDWRDGTGHLDAVAGFGPHDRSYFAANVAGGEGFDWFYASQADRDAQLRTPITDGAYGKPWVFRPKDLLGWWSNPHVERVGGVELAAPTAWVPRSKPIWLLEVGCGAVDKGGNRPSVFPDAKSAENALPPYSSGSPDPLVQTRALEATLDHWDPEAARYPGGANPVSPVYGGRMVDPARIYAWAWDARPFPAFPQARDVWSDGGNHALGHWLNGRLDALTLDGLVEAIGTEAGAAIDASSLAAPLVGALIDRPMSARAAIEPLAAAFGFAALETSDGIVMRRFGDGQVLAVVRDTLAKPARGPLVGRVRAEEVELPRLLTLAFADPTADYQAAIVSSARLDTPSRLEVHLDVGLALDRGEAARRVDAALQDRWIARDVLRIALAPSRCDIEAGDLVGLDDEGPERPYLVTSVTRSDLIEIEARRIEPSVFDNTAAQAPSTGFAVPAASGPPDVLLLDIPAAPGAEPGLQWLAATADPWPGALAVWRSSDGNTFRPTGAVTRPATMGRVVEPLAPGFAGRWDRAGRLRVSLSGSGTLDSLTPGEVLDGRNLLAVRRADGRFEMLQFATATPVDEALFDLTLLLRGQFGTDGGDAVIPAGSPFALVDSALVPVVTDLDDIGRPLVWRVGAAGLEASDPAIAATSAPPTLVTLQPYAPASVRAWRGPDGVHISLVRRSRLGGDNWSVAEVPLGEAAEAYEVDVLLDGAVKRTLRASSPSLLYPQSDEVADFGSIQSLLVLRACQISAVAGRGSLKQVTLHV